jgi:TatD DNase family protein
VSKENLTGRSEAKVKTCQVCGTAMLFDTHCHLDIEKFDDDRAAVLQRARDAGVSMMLNPAFDLASSRRAVALAQANDDIVAAVGIHPTDTAEFGDATLAELRALIDDARAKAPARKTVVAIGEIGLDYYWKNVPPATQASAFIAQLNLAREMQLPVIIHCRDAYEDTIDILRRHGRGLPLVMHSFLGDEAHVSAILDLGYFVGLGGPVTYPSSRALRDIVKTIPLERMLIETDAPYLAPQAQRGRRNEPAHVRFVAEKIAEIQGGAFEDVARATGLNGRKLFGLET